MVYGESCVSHPGVRPADSSTSRRSLITFIRLAEPDSSVECPPITGFTGPLTRVSDGLREGSTAQFICPTGQYPWPVSSRTCLPTGKWSVIKSSTGRKYNSITCKNMRCPAPISFDNGEFFPRGPYMVGANITFQCNDGYQMRGSRERTCKKNAKWSGEMAVCDDGVGHCPDPGVPPGAVKTGVRYDIDESVYYDCSSGLILMGTKRRTCLESRRWSGNEASCQYPYAFDLPEDVGNRFIGSISGVLKTKQKPGNKSVGRTITIKKDGILNVHILLDASQSIGQDNFNIYKECAQFIVDGLGRFDMKVQFSILSYASETHVIIRVHDKDSDDSDIVSKMIEDDLSFSSHTGKSGTNTKAAIEEVLEIMAFQETKYSKTMWESIQHVIILLTDGKANVGGQPKEAINRIREFLDINPKREDFLDVYVFGVGAESVDKVELNDIASKKEGEKHVFILESADDMKKVFAEILVIKTYGDMCGLNDELDADKWSHHYPWTASIQTTAKEPCLGSLISKYWVLSAAHCFKIEQAKMVQIGHKKYKVKEMHIHECYNLTRKASRGVKEDYDYDVALLKLEEPVEFSTSASPICVPCTEPANRAMKKIPQSTCKEHREWLFNSNEVPAGYLAKDAKKPKDRSLTRLSVNIQINQARDACVSAVRTWDPYKTTDPSLLVSPRHLCVKGDMSCKGESGGPLFMDLKRRFFQVGVLSFGLFNPCLNDTRKAPPPGTEARDFYVSILEILPWLRRYVSDDLEFLPGTEVQENLQCPA
ncbi:LOW QUALITY PROTEIN: complement C2-like [Pelodytes ibericus]